jgi:glucose-6-phosphate 1-epimerase
VDWNFTGAHLLNANFGGAPLFYLSPAHLQIQGKPARGGVPVMFPQFANKGAGPKHGLVRQQLWTCVSKADSAARFTLELLPDPAQLWFGHARLTLSAALTNTPESAAPLFSMVYRIENSGSETFDFTGGLHPYFRVEDVTQVALHGLSTVAFEDRYGASNIPEAGFLKGQAFERLYLSAPALVLEDGANRLKISSQRFDNWMVWNPGAELALEFPDMPPQDWRRFLCVEPVVAAKPMVLAPGACFSGEMQVERVS